MKELYAHLKEFLSENKIEIFEKIAAERTKHLTVVLENLYHSHNTSAVIRSSDCFGIQDIHVIDNEHEFEVSEGIAIGSFQWVNIHHHSEGDSPTIKCIKELKEKGYQIVATTPHEKDTLIQDLDVSKPTALVFGTEVRGITQEVKDHADAFVKVPMYGFTESFNISVAAAISLYEITKRLKESDIPWQLTEEEQLKLKIEWAKISIKKSELIVERFLKENN